MVNRTETGQLDDISVAIGRIEEYIRSNRHGVTNLSAKMDGVAAQVSKDLAVFKENIDGEFKSVKERISSLELASAKNDGQKTVWYWIAQSPIVAWLLALLTMSLAYINAHFGAPPNKP